MQYGLDAVAPFTCYVHFAQRILCRHRIECERPGGEMRARARVLRRRIVVSRTRRGGARQRRLHDPSSFPSVSRDGEAGLADSAIRDYIIHDIVDKVHQRGGR